MVARFVYGRYASKRSKDARPIVFVDSKVTDYANIIQNVNPQARAIVLGSHTPGIQSLTNILVASTCHEVHIVATGSPGCIRLGSQELSLNTLIQHEDELRTWFDFPAQQTAISGSISASSWIESLTVVPSISFYGCSLGAGDGGEELISRLSQVTRAKILASRDILRHEVFCNGEGRSQS